MFRIAPRRSLRLLPILILPVAALAVGSAASASTEPPTTPDASDPAALPEGYVRLVDDTGFLTVVVPETWTTVDTVPSAQRRRLPAAVDPRLDRRPRGVQRDVHVRGAVSRPAVRGRPADAWPPTVA